MKMPKSPPGHVRPRLTRPQKWVAGLGLLMLALGLANLGKAVMAARYAVLLPDLPMTVPWGYLVATGAFWGLVLSACGIALWLRRPWARWATPATATLYQAHVWLNHLLFDASDYARQTRSRDLVLTLLLLALTWGLLNAPATRKTFHLEGDNERENR